MLPPTMPYGTPPFDQDRLIAAVDMIGRAAAKSLELGWDGDDVPKPGDLWYAEARYKGARVFVDQREGPVEAAEALLFKLLEGAECVRCGKHVVVPGYRLAGGAEGCEYRREGNRWVRGCDGGSGPPKKPLNKYQRARAAKAKALRG